MVAMVECHGCKRPHPINEWCLNCWDGVDSARHAGESDAHAQPGDQRFRALLDELWAMHVKKSHDYGNSKSGDPLANIRASADFGIPAWLGAMVRANDKVHRIKEYARTGTLANEGVRDSLLDLAAYSLIALVLFDEDVTPE